MSVVMNNEVLVSCKNCNTVVTAKWNSGLVKKGWRLKESKGRCPTCHQPIKLKNLETLKCPHCEKLVERSADNRCINCHKILQAAPMRGQVPCPECGMLVNIPLDSEGDCACSVCGTVLDRKLIELRLGQSAVEQEQYIRLPDVERMIEEDRAIWKHPQSTFPFKSRMQVNEGTFALFLQNGSCKAPCEPGSYLLEDSDLEKSQKLDAAMDGGSVTFNTDIYCILQDLPEMKWGANVAQLQNQERTASYSAAANGRIALQVCDAKAYARHLGFKPVSISSLVRVDSEPGSPDGVLLQSVRDMLSESLYACLNGMEDRALAAVATGDVRDRLTMELNRRLAGNGLCVKTLWINVLDVAKSESAAAADRLKAWAQSEFSWVVKGARLNSYGNRQLYADFDFDGTFRLRVADDERFFGSSEMAAFAANAGTSESAVKEYIQSRVLRVLKNDLVSCAQEQINQGFISDLLDVHQYPSALNSRLRLRLEESLAPEGLAVAALSINLPGSIVKSEALATQLDIPKRRQAIRRAVESALRLRTDPVRVHLKDDKSVFVDLVFKGLCSLRVREEDAFFGLSEVQGFLTDSRAVSDSAVIDYYARKINPVFREVLSRITQGVVDQTNADIREINRFTYMLKENVLTNMAPRIEGWGLSLEALDLDGIDVVGTSPNLERQAALEQTRSGVRLDEEIQRINNDHAIFMLEENGRVTLRGKDIADDISAKDDEIELRRLERKHIFRVAELQKGAELDKLVDEIAEGKRARADEAVLEEYKRRFRLREEQLNQELREQRIAQEGQIDAQRRKQQAEFERTLNEAENKRALNDIMRKIAESDLNWQQKLDEYDRLRQRVSAETQADIRRIEADAELKITRDKDEFYYESNGRKIKLRAEEAELLERINRYDEERRARETQAEEARLERRATLDFERRMQERREQVAREIDRLKLEYDHELAMREKEVDLQKLMAELKYHTEAGAQSADVEKARATAETAARIAEAQAAAKRLEMQLQREDDIAQRAEDFRKALLEVQTALEKTRLANERNRDDRTAEVAIAAEKRREVSPGMTKDERREVDSLEKEVQRIVNSVKDLRRQLGDLKKMIPAGAPMGGGWPYPPVNPWNPQPRYSDGATQPQPPTQPYAPGPATPQPGAAAERRCATCGHILAFDDRACPVCGSPVV